MDSTFDDCTMGSESSKDDFFVGEHLVERTHFDNDILVGILSV